MTFNDRTYTRDSIIKQLGLIELHGKDGSALDAGCQCIDTKHLYLLEGLSEEGMGFSLSAEEKEFYSQLADLSRRIRKNMEVEDYNLHGVMREVMKKKYPTPLKNPGDWNPGPRKYLPYGLTECEKSYPSVRKKLSSCIRQTEKKPGAYKTFNPVAVCRATIKCPP